MTSARIVRFKQNMQAVMQGLSRDRRNKAALAGEMADHLISVVAAIAGDDPLKAQAQALLDFWPALIAEQNAIAAAADELLQRQRGDLSDEEVIAFARRSRPVARSCRSGRRQGKRDRQRAAQTASPPLQSRQPPRTQDQNSQLRRIQAAREGTRSAGRGRHLSHTLCCASPDGEHGGFD